MFFETITIMKQPTVVLVLLSVLVTLVYCDNVEKYKQIIALVYKYSEKDVSQMLPLFDPNVNWVSYGPQNYTNVGYYKGRDGILKFFQDDAKVYTLTRVTPGPMIGEKNLVTVIGEEEGNMAVTNVPFVNHWVHLFEFNNSTLLITRFVQHLNNHVFPTPPSV